MPNPRYAVPAAGVLILLGLGATAPGYAHPQNNSRPAAQPCVTLPALAKVTATDTGNGSAIELTASGDPINVRSYAQRMALMYNHMVSMQSGMPMRGSGMGMGMHGPGMHGGMMGGAPMHLVPSHASAENTSTGARIVLVPNDASQRTALRDQARRQATMMQQGECPLRQQAAG